MCLNHPELVPKHPAHLVSPLTMLIEKFRYGRTTPNVAGETRCAWCLCPRSGWFKHIEPLHDRDSKVWRVLTHEFGVVRPYRNFSINIFKGETRRAGCLDTSSGWFKHIEPHRTYTNPCNDVDRAGSTPC